MRSFWGVRIPLCNGWTYRGLETTLFRGTQVHPHRTWHLMVMGEARPKSSQWVLKTPLSLHQPGCENSTNSLIVNQGPHHEPVSLIRLSRQYPRLLRMPVPSPLDLAQTLPQSASLVQVHPLPCPEPSHASLLPLHLPNTLLSP